MNAKCILIKHKIYGTGDSQHILATITGIEQYFILIVDSSRDSVVLTCAASIDCCDTESRETLSSGRPAGKQRTSKTSSCPFFRNVGFFLGCPWMSLDVLDVGFGFCYFLTVEFTLTTTTSSRHRRVTHTTTPTLFRKNC